MATIEVGTSSLEEKLQRALEAERQRRIDLTVALRQLEEAQQIIEQTSRLTQEMEIASRIQTSILPSTLAAPWLEVAAVMKPASEVGGDYYDVRFVDGACWIGIGDVAGHGLTAGVIMLMIQSMVAALVQVSPQAPPSQLLSQLNRVLYDNVRNRLGRSEFATLSLLRIASDGTVRSAGAHQDVIVKRAGATECEVITVPGTWVAITDSVHDLNPERSWTLAPGDLMVLYTDGVSESVGPSGEHFGVDRLASIVASIDPRASTQAIVDAVLAELDAFAPWVDDDATVVVVRRTDDQR